MYEKLSGKIYWVKISSMIQTDDGHINSPVWIGLDPDGNGLLYAPQAVGGPAESPIKPFSDWIENMEQRKGDPLDGLQGDKLCIYASSGGNIGFDEPEPDRKTPSGSMANPYEQYQPFIKRIVETTPLRVLVG